VITLPWTPKICLECSWCYNQSQAISWHHRNHRQQTLSYLSRNKGKPLQICDFHRFVAIAACNPSNRLLALRGHVTSFLWKWKLHNFVFITLFKPASFAENEKVRGWSYGQNYELPFSHANCALKLHGKYWKDDVVTLLYSTTERNHQTFNKV